jgi:AcrR family transcriptional regulator
MGRTAGRSAGGTRRLVLDAAGELFRTRGTTATLDEIAQHAGVSKGGLLYHFATKDALIRALITALLDDFRDAVRQHLDPGDDHPGRLVRAYVRACLDVPDVGTVREATALVAQLVTNPVVADIARADARRWRAELAQDGLAASTVRLVVAAADGASMAPLWGADASKAERRRLTDQLVALTRDP